MSSSFLAGTKSFLINTGAGVASAAILALFTMPEQSLQLNSLALGLLSIPIFLAMGSLAIVIYGLYLVIKIIDAVATHIGIFDAGDIL